MHAHSARPPPIQAHPFSPSPPLPPLPGDGGWRGGVGESVEVGRAVYVHAHISVYGCVWEFAMPLDNNYQRIERIPADIEEYSSNRCAWRFPDTAIHL